MSFLHEFLGTRRWKILISALNRETSHPRTPALGAVPLLLAIVVSITPVVLNFIDGLSPESVTVLPTIAFGICAVLALLIRSGYKLGFVQGGNWKEQLSLTHTAVALGCVPAVLVIITSPNLFAERHEALVEPVTGVAAGGPMALTNILLAFGTIIAMAAWIAVTEELIFRSLLVSVLRRASFITDQRKRDVLACVVSAILFGLAHYPTWGMAAAIALTGLGLGFVTAYIANGERVLPIIVYHFGFDLLSISLSVFF